jgi:CMP-N-acetylneuraminic acid synthetase/spore coat polysaccharide biosynthesis predicted glycosyltransferase SpsG
VNKLYGDDRLMNFLVVIPARGGSKGIPKKNVRLMVGKPLISYSIGNALHSKYDLDVVVSTDDDEIERISIMYGAEVIKRPSQLATDNVTLDPVIYHAVTEMTKNKKKNYDVIITMQPTSPLLKSSTLDSAIEYFLANNFDTVISGVNRPHLSWTEIDGRCIPQYKERLNRQYLPKNYLETGAFFISKIDFVHENSRFGSNVSVFEVSDNESIDIDSPQDWWVAEKELSKKSIIIRTDGYSEIGLGHIYRALLLAYNLIDHDIRFVISNKSDIGIEKIKNSHFSYEVINNNYEIGTLIEKYQCDILINDILDTDAAYIQYCKQRGIRVVNFEDLGSGADYADAVINDLYEKQKEGKNYYWGSDYYCIRDEFLLANPSNFNNDVKEVLIIFGGTDPCDLTGRLFDIVKSLQEGNNVHFTFILGMGYSKAEQLMHNVKKMNINVDIIQNVKLMTEYMRRTDIAISSQGRTMLELASMAVPTILLAQNNRELHHEFGYLKNGFINLGLGNEVHNQTIRETLLWLINCPEIRVQMRNQMLESDLKSGIKRVIKIILNENL